MKGGRETEEGEMKENNRKQNRETKNNLKAFAVVTQYYSLMIFFFTCE